MPVIPKYLPLCLLLTAGPLLGVSVESNSIDNKAVFAIDFGTDSRVMLATEASIASIALQEYITASYRVVELNIVSTGNALTRIYYSRLLKPGEAQAALSDAVSTPSIRQPLPASIQAMADKAAGVTEKLTSDTVIKEYPLATHARTVEYRLKSRTELISLYDELEKHWTKEPAFFKDGQIVEEDETGSETSSAEEKPRTLGGTRFTIDTE